MTISIVTATRPLSFLESRSAQLLHTSSQIHTRHISIYRPGRALPYSNSITSSATSRCLSQSRIYWRVRKTGRRPISFDKHARIPKHRAQTQPFHLTFGRSVLSPNHQLKSSVGGWSALVAVGVVSGLYVLYNYIAPKTTKEQLTEGLERREPSLHQSQLDIAAMTGELLPGRPGNLTPQEEEKLREMWNQVFQLFNVLPPSAKTSLDTNHPDTSDAKKKRGLFSRKKKDGPEAAEEDKFGLQKAYNDAIANTSPEVLRSTTWFMVKHDHPDALLLRFLRARKWDVEKAVIMMIATMNWRATQMHVDDVIMHDGELGCLEKEQNSTGTAKTLGHDVLAQMRMGKSFVHGHDRENRPMCYVRARLHKQGEQSDDSLEWYTVFLIETTRMLLAPPVDTACIVFDLTGFSLANMDYTPVKFMIKCFEANYPESLGAVIVYKAPWVFQGIWRIIKGLLDPVVASKVNFANTVEEMETFVERSKIPKELGGDEDWTYKYVEPIPGENDRMKDADMREKLLASREEKVREFESLTKDWITSPTETELRQKREVVARELRDGYWKLDPYVRARSMYDRIGVIGEGGVLSLYPGARQGVNGGAEKVVVNHLNATAPQGFQHSVHDID